MIFKKQRESNLVDDLFRLSSLRRGTCVRKDGRVRGGSFVSFCGKTTVAVRGVVATMEDERGGKRAKRASRYDEGDYVPGALMRVRLHNFMTHRDATFEPGPRLNVVLGPNGTGKSAFVCAVCVGLGGSPKLLGRAGSLGDFVKRGEESAWTEVTLRGRRVGEPIVVRREFKNRDGGASTWKINGTQVRHEQVLEEMKGLNMQLDNLCSFLPQDRVVAFSMLSPQELLLETEKAIGNAEMFKLHERLKAMKAGMIDLERSVDQKTNRLEKLVRDNESLERDVTRLQERETIIQKATQMSTKIPWLKYGKQSELFATVKNAYTYAKEQVAECRAEHAKRMPTYTAVETKFKAKAIEVSNSRENYLKLKTKLKQMDNKFNTLAAQSEATRSKLLAAQRDAAESNKKIAKRQQHIELLESQLNEVPEIPADLNEQKQRLRDDSLAKQEEIRQADEAHRKSQAEQRPIEEKYRALQRQLEQIDSVRMQKISNLAKRFPQLKDADDWVQRQRPTFHGDVHGPLIAEIEVTDPVHQNYIEQHLGPHVLATYIVTDRRDEHALSEKMKGFKINVWFRRNDQHVPGVVTSELRRVGVESTLDNIFKAPPVVKQALNDTHRICKVHVGNNTLTSSIVNDLFKNRLADHIYCPNGVYRAQRSRYDANAMSMNQSGVRPNRFFVKESSTSRQDIANQFAQADQKLKELRSKSDALRQAYVQRQQEMSELSRRRKQLNDLASEPEQRRKRIEAMINQNKSLIQTEQQSSDVARIEKDCLDKQKKITQDRVALAMEMCKSVHAAHKVYSEHTVNVLMGTEISAQMDKLATELSEIEDRVNVSKKHRDELKEKYTVERAKAVTLKEEAMSIVELTPEVEAMFSQWPTTIEELEFEINKYQEQADAILCPNPMVLDEYNRRRAEMKDLERKLEEQTATLKIKQDAIAKVKAEWLPQLQRTIAKISEQFSENFAQIACAGQVTLAGDGSREHGGYGDDFKEYSLEIRVKFRANEDMHLLDSHRQSGGERSVTTMLYMIALQPFTSAPFRVVDEINQGMDARNERKVFKRMVEAASQKNTPQCFVITPKLLTQLEYSEDCTVMCIFNGPHVHEMAKRWREMQASFDAASAPVTC